jgi:hypothetical protein
MSVYDEVRGFAGFLAGLPAFVRQRISLDEARAIVLQRMRDREKNFLVTLERGVFANRRSPYRALLARAGCEPADLRAMVPASGIEGTLRTLRDAGVYVSFEEFKGQRPIVRDGREIPVRAEDFDNPHLTHFHAVGTGGSTGGSRRVLMDLEHLRARLPMLHLGDTFHGTAGIPTALWFEIPPGNGLDSTLMRVQTDSIPERWFTPVRGKGDGAAWRFRAATAVAVAVARAAGARVPRPEYLPMDQARVIAHWAAGALRRRGACAVRSHVSKAMRVCVAAKEEGIDLTGAVVVGGGEPPTPGKVAQIRSTGARFVSGYHFTEVGTVGFACVNATDPNDQHLFIDHLALIQSPRAVPGFDVTVPSFQFTTLLPTAPKLLLNVESDDYGTVETRSCGCPFESLGMTTHVSDIRSFRKLTGEGVTLIGSDMERILEQELPARCGGTPLDYQLVEEEDERGFTRLTILVHPRLGPVDDDVVVGAVLGALSRGGAAANMSRGVWGQAKTLRVRREAPHTTSRGKLMPLHAARRSAAATADEAPVAGPTT